MSSARSWISAGPRALLGAAALSTVGALLAPPAGAASTPPTCGGPAAAVISGYLWGDGYRTPTGTWGLRAPSQRAAERIGACAAQRYPGTTTTWNPLSSRWVVRFPSSVDADFSPADQQGMPRRLQSAGITFSRAFVGGVLEGEGNATTGLVLDDPKLARVAAFRTVLSRIGVTTTVDGGPRYSWVYAVRSSWSAFCSVPVASIGRVPGGSDCVR